jgi:hypothetical protein
MKPQLKAFLAGLAVIIFVCILVRLSWSLSSVSEKVKIIRAEYSFTKDWYSTYSHLGDMLKLGMTPDEVSAILGEPDVRETLAGGKRWVYSETGPTAGGTCVVDFAPDKKTFHLCFFIDVQNVVFPDSPHCYFGVPIDDGKFDGDFLLKKSWDIWHGKQPAGSASKKCCPSTISISRINWAGETAAVYTGVSLAASRGTTPAIEAGLSSHPQRCEGGL